MDKTAKALADFRNGLDAGTRIMVDRLCAIVRKAAPDLVEDFKWKAPSYRKGETHCVTLGLNPKGGVRMVLHRDAKAKDTTNFRFDDPARLADWPAVDRGVIAFPTLTDIEAVSDALEDMIARWVVAAT